MPERSRTWLRGEVTLLVVCAHLALRLAPVRRCVLPARLSRVTDPSARADLRATVKSAIFAHHQTGWLRTTCAHRALVAHWMLRRRGVQTTVCYGARTGPHGRLEGHLWVMDGDVFVVGEDGAAGCPHLLTLPLSDDALRPQGAQRGGPPCGGVL